MAYEVVIKKGGSVIARGKGNTNWRSTATRLYNRKYKTKRHIALESKLGNGLYQVQFGVRVPRNLGGGTSLDDRVVVVVN